MPLLLLSGVQPLKQLITGLSRSVHKPYDIFDIFASTLFWTGRQHYAHLMAFCRLCVLAGLFATLADLQPIWPTCPLLVMAPQAAISISAENRRHALGWQVIGVYSWTSNVQTFTLQPKREWDDTSQNTNRTYIGQHWCSLDVELWLAVLVRPSGALVGYVAFLHTQCLLVQCVLLSLCGMAD